MYVIVILKRPKLAGDLFSQICAFISLKLLGYGADSEPFDSFPLTTLLAVEPSVDQAGSEPCGIASSNHALETTKQVGLEFLITTQTVGKVSTYVTLNKYVPKI
jgi:hypothetical protein